MVIDAAAMPAARQPCQSSVAVVVLPSVPVIPTTQRSPARMVVEGGGQGGERQPRVADDEHRGSRGRSGGPGAARRRLPTAPRSTASAMNRWPSDAQPGDRHEQAARGHRARVGCDRGDRDAVPRDGWSAASIPAASSRAASGRAARVGCTVAVYGRVAAIMAGKKQKRGGAAGFARRRADRDTRGASPRPGAGGAARGDGADDPRRHGSPLRAAAAATAGARPGEAPGRHGRAKRPVGGRSRASRKRPRRRARSTTPERSAGPRRPDPNPDPLGRVSTVFG